MRRQQGGDAERRVRAAREVGFYSRCVLVRFVSTWIEALVKLSVSATPRARISREHEDQKARMEAFSQPSSQLSELATAWFGLAGLLVMLSGEA